MKSNKYLEGENIAPVSGKQARALLGRTVRYLRDSDIDRSGRGYYFPKTGAITGIHRGHIEIDGDWISMSRIVEMEAA